MSILQQCWDAWLLAVLMEIIAILEKKDIAMQSLAIFSCLQMQKPKLAEIIRFRAFLHVNIL